MARKTTEELDGPFWKAVSKVEKDLISRAIREVGTSWQAVAGRLGVSLPFLRGRVRRYKLSLD